MRYQFAVSSFTVAMLALSPAAFGQCSAGSSSDNVALAAMSQQRQDIVDTAVAAGTFNTLAAALEAADLIGALKGDGPFTVFAPTDEAFAKLPRGTVENLLKPENKDKLVSILTYHVVQGEVPASRVTGLSNAASLNGQRLPIAVDGRTVKVAGARVTATDIRATNGIIHVIDTVMLPNTNDIVDTAKEAGSFATLLAAAKAAGLVDALKGDGPFTIFAPTDEAFAKLGTSTIENLLKPENKEQLQAILLYHVVPGRVYADSLRNNMRPETLSGKSFTVSMQNDRVMVDRARVVKTDIDTTNGVIHVIDTVIVPE